MGYIIKFKNAQILNLPNLFFILHLVLKRLQSKNMQIRWS